MILDGRTRDGAEQKILHEIDAADGIFRTTIFWITRHQKRACAATRLINRGVISTDHSGGYPRVNLFLK